MSCRESIYGAKWQAEFEMMSRRSCLRTFAGDLTSLRNLCPTVDRSGQAQLLVSSRRNAKLKSPILSSKKCWILGVLEEQNPFFRLSSDVRARIFKLEVFGRVQSASFSLENRRTSAFRDSKKELQNVGRFAVEARRISDSSYDMENFALRYGLLHDYHVREYKR